MRPIDRAREVVVAAGLGLLAALAWSEMPARGQVPDSPAAAPARTVAIAGRVIDGLERPVAGVTIKVLVDPPDGLDPTRWQDDEHEIPVLPPSKHPAVATLATGADGRYAGSIATAGKLIRLDFAKEGYEAISGPIEADGDRVMRALLGKRSVYDLALREGDELDRDLRWFFASAEWEEGGETLRRDFFKYQGDLRPAARRLATDRIVGAAAKQWLGDIADPADKELVAAPPPKDPLPDIREADLIEAIKATARRVNWFSSDPEPRISLDQITLTPGLDRAMVECGVNVAAMTGVFWRFVFHREGGRWVLRAMVQTGRA